MLKRLCAGVCLVICALGMWHSSHVALARLFSANVDENQRRLLAAQGAEYDSLAAAEKATGYDASDPLVKFGLAQQLIERGRPDEAREELEQAIRLRPDEFWLWSHLGLLRNREGDVAGAQVAFREAIRLAPYYAQPYWQLGNSLLRAGAVDEGFAELRRAAQSDVSLLPFVMGVAWRIADRDAAETERLLQLTSTGERLELVKFLIKKSSSEGAARVLRATSGVTDKQRDALVRDALVANQFRFAFNLWASEPGREGKLIFNEGFEQDFKPEEATFGWRVPRRTKVLEVALDTRTPREGKRSLRVGWKGISPPGNAVVSQLLVVEPNARYILNFTARTGELTTGGLPVLVITDAGKPDVILGSSEHLPQGTTDWQSFQIQFTTPNETVAVLLGLKRQACSSEPCPAFGRAWLDDFKLIKSN